LTILIGQERIPGVTPKGGAMAEWHSPVKAKLAKPGRAWQGPPPAGRRCAGRESLSRSQSGSVSTDG
jgi:hypothetical protein